MCFIQDNHGTRQFAWTRKTALVWLACTADQAQITNLWGRVVATRTQVRVY